MSENKISENWNKNLGFIGPTADMAGRRVDFGRVGEGNGLAWGVELDISIEDGRARYRLEEGNNLKIPSHIKFIRYLDLSPQEALPRKQRNIGSKLGPSDSSIIKVATPEREINPILGKLQKGFGLLGTKDEKRFRTLGAMISWAINSSGGNKERLTKVLDNSVGDTFVIVHGHSHGMRAMGEQDSDGVVGEDGSVIQAQGNMVSIDSILERYNNPDKYAAIILHGCNIEGRPVEEKDVKVFYPPTAVVNEKNPRLPWSKAGGWPF